MALETNKSKLYRPYPKQEAFHNEGANHQQRLFMAGNRQGKTWGGGMEVSYHATGDYPDWWKGKRFTRPVKIIVAGRTSETTRDVPQLMLMGEPEQWGTGTLPRSAIRRTVLGRGITDALDSVSVQYVTGGVSIIKFKQYSQERQAMEGYDADIVWFDEEPSFKVYNEGLTRTHSRNGIVFITFTPMLGMSDVVENFYPIPRTENCSLTRMGIRECHWIDENGESIQGHLTDERIEEMIESYAPHEREARANGEPTLGTGKIFPIEEEMFSERPILVPSHFFQIGGVDFGFDHPTACVVMAEDREHDILHVTHAYRQRLETPVVHAHFMRTVGGDWLPWAWPQDGYQHDKQSGVELATNYRDEQHVYMLPEHAKFESGSNGLEEGVLEMYDRFRTGRLLIDCNLKMIFDEIRTYHRDENGKIVKKKEDLLCAIRYAMMCRRYGEQLGAQQTERQFISDVDPLNMPPSGYGGSDVTRIN